MAKVTRESIGELHDKIVVSLTKDDYLPSFQKALKDYKKRVNMPGFRKGNVPMGMIKKMYGPSIFAEEVINSANQEIRTFMETEKPEVFGQPLVMEGQDLKLDMNQTDDIDIAFEIGMKPSFEIPSLNEKGKLTRYVIDVNDEMVNKEVDNLRRRTGELTNPESPEEDTDMVYSTYIMCDEEGNPIEGAEANEDIVTLENLPKKIANKVKGQSADFSFVFQPSKLVKKDDLEEFMHSALKKTLDEKDNFFKFTLSKTGRMNPSEMNEEFFTKVFPNEQIKDEETFRKRLREELEKEAKRAGEVKLQNEIFENLVHTTPIDLPVDFLKNWMKRAGEQVKSDEEVEQEYPGFDHSLRWNLISEKLVKQFDIKVTEEDVRQEMKDRVKIYFGMTEDTEEPWLENYLDQMLKDEKSTTETYNRLLTDKLFGKIADELEVKEEKVGEETFTKLAEAGHHHHHH